MPDRATGCIDTPFVGPDHRATTSGVQCGREPSPEPVLLRGRVVGEEPGGLPGPGLEEVWVSVHVIEGPLRLGELGPARAETRTGPQGAFSIALTGAGEYVVVVRGEPEGPALTARRVEARADVRTPELVLTVPLDEALRERLRGPSPAPGPSPGATGRAEGPEPPSPSIRP